jgi:hypothetical protein
MLNSTPKLLLGVRRWTRESGLLSPFPAVSIAPLLTRKDMRGRGESDAFGRRLFGLRSVFAGTICLVMGIVLLGCSPQNPIESPVAGSLTRSVDAEWDNVATAVEVGASQVQCAVVRSEASEDGTERRFEIKHATGRHGVVIAHRAPSPDEKTSEPIELSCTFGPTRDPELERKVLSRITHRLNDLRGKAFAPIRE